jgi:hypothetical protein
VFNEDRRGFAKDLLRNGEICSDSKNVVPASEKASAFHRMSSRRKRLRFDLKEYLPRAIEIGSGVPTVVSVTKKLALRQR